MQNSKIEDIHSKTLPKHIAIIMDGNGRWARLNSLPRIAGHRKGVDSVREITRICGELGVQYLTLYTFSTENWSRPDKEVKALMRLLLATINLEVEKLHKKNVRFQVIGNLDEMPKKTANGMKKAIKKTKDNSGLTLCCALNYGSRQEILMGISKIIKKVENGQITNQDVDEELLSNNLYTKEMPDPDLIIRTSGENRLSNFLLWQSAYSEIYITDTYWPDFGEKALFEAITNYQKRERRYGKLSRQIR